MARENVGQRKVWVYEGHSPRPGLAALFRGPEGRQDFYRYWFKEGPGNALDISVYFALKILPIDACSDLGARYSRYTIPRQFKQQEKRARANLARLRPDLTDAQRDAMFIANCDAQGRFVAEYSVLMRIAAARPRRVQRVGAEKMLEAVRDGPVILAAMHLGNWEIMAPELVEMGVVPNVNFAPPPQRGRNWITRRVRSKAGLRLLPSGYASIRPAFKELKSGGVIVQFCDEGFRGVVRGPLFGRPPTTECNMAVIARLARMTGAKIAPIYCVRTHQARFIFHCVEPFSLPPNDGKADTLMDDIVFINAVVEPIIRAHLEQWYFLDNRLPPGAA